MSEESSPSIRPASIPGFGSRVAASIVAAFGLVIFFLLDWVFWATSLTSIQSAVVAVVAVLVFIATNAAAWAGWGARWYGSSPGSTERA